MTIHLVKLCVGAETLADLEAWVAKRSAMNEAAGRGRVHDHVTRMFPKRCADLLDGGSLYWVVKGDIRVRQRIVDLETDIGADGIQRWAILLDPFLTAVAPHSRKAFQGWRYLRPEDAPPDLGVGSARIEATLRAELSALGLL